MTRWLPDVAITAKILLCVALFGHMEAAVNKEHIRWF